MAQKKPELPPEVINKLTRSNEPMIADLQGPGPFRLPLLSKVESILGPDQLGRLEIRLETESAQEVRIVLTEEAAAKLRSHLQVYFLRQEELAKGRKN